MWVQRNVNIENKNIATTVCSIDDIYLYSYNTQNVLTLQDILKVLPDPDTFLFLFQIFWKTKKTDKSALYGTNTGIGKIYKHSHLEKGCIGNTYQSLFLRNVGIWVGRCCCSWPSVGHGMFPNWALGILIRMIPKSVGLHNF